MILIIRHGELENPRGIVYNRDSVMRPEDIIHLSEKGCAQFPKLAVEIRRQNKMPTILWNNPETRAQESAEILQDGEIPDPGKIRSMMYPPKGSATLLTYTDRGEFVKLEPFGDPSLRGGSNY